MKKICLLAIAAAFAVNASAEGYQVNTLSAKQLGMGHTGVSQKLNSESLWFNPAAAAFQENKFSVAAGVTGIMATATYKPVDLYYNELYEGNETTRKVEESDNDWSTPMYFSLNYKINDKLGVGLSFNTPYGSSMNWGDSWSGAALVQSISMQAYNAQPTISYKINDKLSVGAGLMLSWGSFELSRALAYDYSGYFTEDYTMPIVSANLEGDASMAFGVNVGIMYDINDKWSLGASYRSKMMMKVDGGHAALSYLDDDVEDFYSQYLGGMTTGTFEAELPLPSTFSVGATFYPTERLDLSAEFQWVGWSAYENLAVTFNEELEGAYDSDTPKNYSNTMMVRFGAQYAATRWLDARVGFYVDESPVSSEYLNPETPSMTKLGYTCGLSIKPVCCWKHFSIDLGYAYTKSADSERIGYYPVEVDGEYSPFGGIYTAKAHSVSFGLSWGF